MSSRAALAGLLWALGCAGVASCGGGSGSAGGAGGAGGEAGSAAAPNCVDIHVDARVLDDPAWDGPALDFVRKAFWRTERGIHVAWLGWMNGTLPAQLVVSTFEPDTGAHLSSSIYDPFPSDTGYAVLVDAAGAPDGSFALVVNYPDQSEVWEVADRLVLGHLDAPGTLQLWDPPYNGAEGAPIHVGWDGEAFALHAVPVPSGPLPMRLSRVRPDGTAIESDRGVGAPIAADLMYSAIRTDPDSGRTWTLSTASEGVWLGGHDREGALLPGTEAEGAVLVQAQGAGPSSTSTGLSVAPDGTEAILAWYAGGVLENRFQRVADSTPEGDAVVLPDPPFDDGYLGDSVQKALERRDGGWWVGIVRPLGGIASVQLTEDTIVDDRILVRHEPCSKAEAGCATGEQEAFVVSHLQSLRYGDELWLGFLDGSGAYLDGSRPYRVVRVSEGCQYTSEALVLKGR